jgi:endonuclease/exonuclease/phosphatase family metal-dependent hydrolase
VALAAEVAGLLVATTHLSFVPGYNLLQLRRLTRFLEGLARPAVLLGDLNAPAPLPGWVTRWRPLARARTYPAGNPRLQVDHVLGHGPLPTVAASQTSRLPLSDHLALTVDLAT